MTIPLTERQPEPVRRLDLAYPATLTVMVCLLLGTWYVMTLRLASVPPGIEADTGFDVLDALRISRGVRLPLDFDTRPEQLHRYLLAIWLLLTGPAMPTLRLFTINLGLLGVAVTYRAMLEVLWGRPARRIGGIVAAGVLAATTPYLFMSRSGYRVVLAPLIVAGALAALLHALRTRRKGAWLAGGLLIGAGPHAYTAGLPNPLWLAGFVFHQALIAPRRGRMGWRGLALVLAGVAMPLAIWLGLVLAVPDMYARVGDVSSAGSGAGSAGLGELVKGRLLDVPDLLRRMLASSRAFYQIGYQQPLINTPHSAFLNNPVTVALGAIGLGVAIWHWRGANGFMLLTGLVLYMLPAALSRERTHSLRLSATMPLVALITGWGASWLAAQVWTLADRAGWARRRWLAQAIALIAFGPLLAGSMAETSRDYQGLFADPRSYEDPANWLQVPSNFTLAAVEALELLEAVEEPTYVPLSALDASHGAFILTRRAFPHVMTWARYGLEQLPAGQVFYPAYLEWHRETADVDHLQALLLPDEDTIVILPPAPDGSPVIFKERETAQVLWSEQYDWPVAYVSRREASQFVPPPPTTGDAALSIGDMIRLRGFHAAGPLEPSATVPVIVEWEVLREIRAGQIQSFVQLINTATWTASGSSNDQYILRYLYPADMWQPGDIVPDVYFVTLSPDLPDGVYLWASGAYLPSRPSRLPIRIVGGLTGPVQDVLFAEVARIPPPSIGLPPPDDVARVEGQFADGIALEGYRLIEGDSLTLELYWRAVGRPAGDYTIFVHVMNGETLLAQADARPQDGALPTWAWLPGELVVTTHTLAVPGGTDNIGAIYVGMYTFPSLERLPIEHNGIMVEDGRLLLWAAPDR